MNTRQAARARGIAAGMSWVLVAGGLASCGGGGGDAGDGSAPPLLSGPEASKLTVAVGDYYVYELTTTTTVPAGTPAQSHTFTRTYPVVGADGSTENVRLYSQVGRSASRYIHAADGALKKRQVGVFGGGVECTYAPGFFEAPPYPRQAGQSWNQTVSEDCTTPAWSSTISQSGQVLAKETITLATGTYSAYKTQTTSTSTGETFYVVNETCWYDAVSGVALRCAWDSTTRQTASTPVIDASSSQMTLVASGGRNVASRGDTRSRFQGGWSLSYVTASTCPRFTVSASGTIQGSCIKSGSGTISYTGSISDSGAFSMTLSNGLQFTGNMVSPFAGTGTQGQANWSAIHD